MRPAFVPTGHRVPRSKPTCLLHTWWPRRRRPFALVLHLHQHQSSCNLHLQYLAKNQSTQRCQSLITQGSDQPSVLEPHMVLSKYGTVWYHPASSRFYLTIFILCQFLRKLTGTLPDSDARATCVKLANPACCVLGVRR
jgi:hypothetical protein